MLSSDGYTVYNKHWIFFNTAQSMDRGWWLL